MDIDPSKLVAVVEKAVAPRLAHPREEVAVQRIPEIASLELLEEELPSIAVDRSAREHEALRVHVGRAVHAAALRAHAAAESTRAPRASIVSGSSGGHAPISMASVTHRTAARRSSTSSSAST